MFFGEWQDFETELAELPGKYARAKVYVCVCAYEHGYAPVLGPLHA